MKKILKKHVVMGVAASTIIVAAVANTGNLGSFALAAAGSSSSVAPGSSTSVAPGSSTSVAPGSSTSVAPGSSTSVPSGGGGGFDGGATTDEQKHITVEGTTATAKIGSSGAIITLAGSQVQVNIPAGAFNNERDIKVTVVKSTDLSVKLPNTFVFGGLAVTIELSGEDKLAVPATVTFKLDAAMVKEIKNAAVFKQDTASGQWLYRGAILDEAKGTISFQTSSFSTYAVLINNKSFPDAANAKWAAEYINYGLAGGFINGYEDGSFKPNNSITRAEFVQIIVRALGLAETSGNVSFKDVPTSAWYNKSLATAVSNNLINGVSADKFAPNNKISREEVATILDRAFALKTTQDDVISNFDDVEKVHDWAVKGVNSAVNAGVITGYEDKTLKPGASITRAEAVTMIVRSLDNVGKVDLK